jgi:flavoprotein hydroxylase
MSHDYDYDIAIVGYGPIGALAAVLFGRRGYRVGVFERWPAVYPLPRAVVFDDEIARIFQQLELTDDVFGIVDPVPDHYEWHNAAGEALLKIDWSLDGRSGWPMVNFFSQPDLQAVLARKAESLPTVEVNGGWEVASPVDEGDHVRFEARRGDPAPGGRWVPSDESREVTARYLIGADGANSGIREALGAEYHDLGFKFDWLILDVIPHDTTRVWSPMNLQVCDPVRPTTIVGSGPGRRRWEFMRLPGETIEELNTEETAWRLLATQGMTPENCTLERHVVYTFGAKWADVWRRGRMMIAGDAAHLMPPFAGQGMCSGLRDVANLGWKLDAVLSGEAPEALLDTYGPERAEHVRAWIDFSVALGRVICVLDRDEAAARDERMIAGEARPERVLPAAPPEHIGPGVASDTPAARTLFIQSEIERAGRRGLFDDVVGHGFVLLGREGAGDPAEALDDAQREFLEDIGGHVVALGDDVADVHGAYAAWFEQHDCSVVLTRPDFYVFGTATSAQGAARLVDDLRAAIMSPAAPTAAAAR